jgi:hypothetical protein
LQAHRKRGQQAEDHPKERDLVSGVFQAHRLCQGIDHCKAKHGGENLRDAAQRHRSALGNG